ncbi:hypothetical protein PSN45_003668 [Yamadazyma tenuis]|uniref:Nucleotide-diphospho-sugar transferase n=1 Tax=Candida tenuis (strain ATCC 10573 / BCRC 21748 / CBS 615 / JCM 9827 / NBRC 10315 / NRRL Y-1498 / VKM Y-70) TaxID=590646 RepID=G3B3P6_CANTC|nr:uncharacterized protein CANTEDRAFT_122543 [Yamadazyma tenuis ATCC 10573]EGV64203.1 hypothetical protein CANTEDRAFT_122543 [Yamadazyma tenuis ATCC 10573]WEJ96132.1 hypothetical protein PSN45_003668 [Yamadazyma tenuis]
MLVLRRKKVQAVAVSALAIIAVVTIVWQALNFNEFEVEIKSSLVGENSKISSFFTPKTKPFSETEAGKQAEIDANINNFDALTEEHKYQLVNQLAGAPSTKNFQFLSSVFEKIYKFRPEVAQLTTYKSEERIYHARYNSKDDDSEDNRIVFNEAYLSSFLQLNSIEFGAMQKSHTKVMASLPTADDVPKGMYEGDGIVFVGGGRFNLLTLLSVKAIRDLGSKLPIEILIPTIEEFESNLCFKVLPQYNAKCILLPQVLKQNGLDDNIFKKFEFKGYQYKVLALLLSSFERILFLDSDNTPTRNPDILFSTNPFEDHGLIVWPDFWKRATSPLYYSIAGIKMDQKKYLPRYNELINDYEDIDYSKFPPKEVPFHQFKGAIPDPTSESGQLMINKKTHLSVLVLALYYNLYGPTHYYPLFSQGSDGEGDKETFLAACVALGCKFYQVKKFLKAMGYFNHELSFVGTGMGQFNPINDYTNEEPDLLFIHSNFPKLNPWELKQQGKILDNGKRIRLYGNGVKKDIGFDFELRQWQNMYYFLCKKNVKVNIFNDVVHDDLCKEISQHLSFLKSTSRLTDDAF